MLDFRLKITKLRWAT